MDSPKPIDWYKETPWGYMVDDKVIEAIRTIRKELVIKDEPLKAYKLLTFVDQPYQKALNDEIKKTYGMVRHVFNNYEYEKAYDIPVDDCEMIEAEEFAINAGFRYPRYQWILDELEKEKAESILDLGCYVGSLVLTAVNRGLVGYGVDMTSGVIKVARKRAKKFGLSKAKFFQADVRLFEGVTSDIVVSLEVLEHIPDPVKYIQHMAKLANKWAYISTPNGPYGNGEGNLTMKGGWEWDGKGVRGHIRVFTPITLRKLIEEDAKCEIGLLEARDDQLLHAKFRQRED